MIQVRPLFSGNADPQGSAALSPRCERHRDLAPGWTPGNLVLRGWLASVPDSS